MKVKTAVSISESREVEKVMSDENTEQQGVQSSGPQKTDTADVDPRRCTVCGKIHGEHDRIGDYTDGYGSNNRTS